MENETVEVKLEISVKQNAVLATLNFINLSSKDVFIEKINGCLEGKIENDVFRIVGGKEIVKYIAPLAKRMPPGANDVVILSKGENFITSVNLCEAYAINTKGVVYSVVYRAYHSSPDGSKPPVINKMESNEARFRY